MKAKRSTPADPELQRIDQLEMDIVRAFDARSAFYALSAADIERERPGIVAQAQAVCNRLRAEYLARRSQS